MQLEAQHAKEGQGEIISSSSSLVIIMSTLLTKHAYHHGKQLS